VIVVARVAGSSGEVPLQVRDVIRSINNQPVTTLQGLSDMVRGLKPGSPVAMQIQREGRLMYLTFTAN
jgi:S1-C subfamily serine protease